MQTIFRKLTLIALAASLVFAALPLSSTYAAGLNEPATPPASGSQTDPARDYPRLEKAFARQQLRVQFIGRAVENFDKRSAAVQKLLDKGKEKGLDVSGVQVAFEAFKTYFIKGKPIYEQAKELVSKHAGFDAAGKLTNPEQARATVKSLADVNKQYRDTVGDSFKALREAIQAFREANPRSTPTPATTG